MLPDLLSVTRRNSTQLHNPLPNGDLSKRHALTRDDAYVTMKTRRLVCLADFPGPLHSARQLVLRQRLPSSHKISGGPVAKGPSKMPPCQTPRSSFGPPKGRQSTQNWRGTPAKRNTNGAPGGASLVDSKLNDKWSKV